MGCFPVNFVKFLRTPFLQNIYGRLLLDMFQTANVCLVTHLIWISRQLISRKLDQEFPEI